ncbi:Na/Pi cotransporter family protein [Ahrensia sp. R2A130]|uniref:Na/Pi cotransporter family protein n=1 Tax=Ahrensia sp. R2A130 TaxID=744979 RepID=UPI0001E09493|nr:Na/Pi cotransporter family protein [Ahrensia sp. R2A130]EFL88485.1 Na+/Pi-cotransporter [Ahrensia sp. R2A130]
MGEPNVLLFALHIAGAAALLIWAVRLVRTGVERAYAVQLRAFLRRSNTNRFQALGSGLLAALCLQSATAVAVLVSNFASKGGLGLLAGLAILLGADIGSAIVSQILLVRQDFLIPLLMLCGVVLFLRGSRNEMQQFGRMMIGVALIFVSLDMIRAATGPLMDSEAAASVMAYLGRDIITSFVIGALFAWGVHSSVAAVLFFVTLTAQGLLPPSGAAAMVLGANAGGAFLAYILTLTAPLAARRMIVANLVLRGGGAALVLFFLSKSSGSLAWLSVEPARQIINLHLVFNIALALVCLPFLTWVAAATVRLLPDRSEVPSELSQSSALDPTTLDRPASALSCASREVMKMGEESEIMLRSVIALFEKWDAPTAAAITRKSEHVSAMHANIKHFLAQLDHEKLSDTQQDKTGELATIALNLEAAANAIAHSLLAQANQLHADGVAFSQEGWADLADFHDRVLSNTQLALNVLMTGAPDAARQLLKAKDKVRKVEQKLQANHLARLRDNNPASFETSQLHQDILRTLKNINAAFAAIGHPVASRSGDLLSTRLSSKSKSSRSISD